jgi:uncharacterized membrane protein/nitrite reductase/ring-hydroxylating ferredoxin subunit
MRSKASIKSHPLHPILVSFPIGFLIGAFVSDLIAAFSGNESFWQTAYYLEVAGIVMGILAAIPGFIDYLYTVPPKSSAKKRGAKHGLLNVTQLVLFSIALIIRTNGNPNEVMVIVLEAAGVIIIGFTGWLGSTLIYRNQIAVDPRYAEAGKWKEEYLDPSRGKMKVASSDELKVNQMKLLHVGDQRIVIGKTEEGYVAFEDHCTHRGGSLAGGAMICSTVQCPWHGSQFHVVTGEVKAGPAKENIKTFPLTEANGNVYLQL